MNISVYRVYVVKSHNVIARLEQEGWILVNVRGVYRAVQAPGQKGLSDCPISEKDLPLGPLKSIYKQAGWEQP